MWAVATRGWQYSSFTQMPVPLLHLAISCPTLGNLNPPKSPSPAHLQPPLCPSSPGHSRGRRTPRTESPPSTYEASERLQPWGPEAQALAPCHLCVGGGRPLLRPPPTWLLRGFSHSAPRWLGRAAAPPPPGTPHSCSKMGSVSSSHLSLTHPMIYLSCLSSVFPLE